MKGGRASLLTVDNTRRRETAAEEQTGKIHTYPYSIRTYTLYRRHRRTAAVRPPRSFVCCVLLIHLRPSTNWPAVTYPVHTTRLISRGCF